MMHLLRLPSVCDWDQPAGDTGPWGTKALSAQARRQTLSCLRGQQRDEPDLCTAHDDSQETCRGEGHVSAIALDDVNGNGRLPTLSPPCTTRRRASIARHRHSTATHAPFDRLLTPAGGSGGSSQSSHTRFVVSSRRSLKRLHYLHSAEWGKGREIRVDDGAARARAQAQPCLMCARREREERGRLEVVRVSPCLQHLTVACSRRVFASCPSLYMGLLFTSLIYHLYFIPAPHHPTPGSLTLVLRRYHTVVAF
jgi:hypothetical protein